MEPNKPVHIKQQQVSSVSYVRELTDVGLVLDWAFRLLDIFILFINDKIRSNTEAGKCTGIG